MFAANGNGKRKFVFLGRQTISNNRRLLYQQSCPSMSIYNVMVEKFTGFFKSRLKDGFDSYSTDERKESYRLTERWTLKALPIALAPPTVFFFAAQSGICLICESAST